MNVGTICYCTQSGLGHLAKQFYDAGIINRILIHPHPRYKEFPEWYRKEDRYFLRKGQHREFCDKLDALIIFENAFTGWGAVNHAKNITKTKFILCPMYEWTPNPLPVKPDYVLCPSLLDCQYFEKYRHEFMTIPVPDSIEWRQRDTAHTFVHNAGHGQVGYAKGTPEVLEAFAKYVKSDAKLLVRGQYNEPRIAEVFAKYKDYPNILIEHGDVSYGELFGMGDVYINAERYNGLSLPLQEAYASGMMVMTSDRFPANDWLPKGPLIPVSGYEKHSVNSTQFDRATIDPMNIAHKVDEWYGKDIVSFSQEGRKWREAHCWSAMKPQYVKLIEQIVGKEW